VVSVVIALVYRYAPNRPNPKWAWLTPGSIIATLLWIAATLGFGFYVSNFGSYNATYGSLGAVVVFLTWLYLTGYILLMGGELNSELEKVAGPKAQAGPN
jgi:membrane protein